MEGKAELVAGKIVRFQPSSARVGLIRGNFYQALHDYASARGLGLVLPASVAFTVPKLTSGRESFSPDAAYHLGPLPADDTDFVPGPPSFAVEVRSKNDYGNAAEAEMAAKRADYFEAGTAVVWDVDPQAKVVRVYRPLSPDQPVVYRIGEAADAEPVMPGWRLDVAAVYA